MSNDQADVACSLNRRKKQDILISTLHTKKSFHTLYSSNNNTIEISYISILFSMFIYNGRFYLNLKFLHYYVSCKLLYPILPHYTSVYIFFDIQVTMTMANFVSHQNFSLRFAQRLSCIIRMLFVPMNHSSFYRSLMFFCQCLLESSPQYAGRLY